MSLVVEKFFSLFPKLETEFLLRLDRNFHKLSLQEGAFSTTTNLTLSSGDLINSVRVDATAGVTTVYLPVNPSGNRRRTVTKVDASANQVVIDGNGSLIFSPAVPAGASTTWVGNQYESLTFEPTGTGWFVVACVP